jgi:hypothetical protein
MGIDPATRDLPQSEYPDARYHICFVFDLIFFAMRRPRERMPFVLPMQEMTGVRPITEGLSEGTSADLGAGAAQTGVARLGGA